MSSRLSAGALRRLRRLDARIRAAVEARRGDRPEPADPFRGLYVSDELALALAARGPGGGARRAARLAAPRGSGSTRSRPRCSALCAAPELSPHYGRLYAYLQDDVDAQARQPAAGRAAARRRRASSAADVLACFAPRRRRCAAAARSGCVEVGGPTPLAERGVKLADRWRRSCSAPSSTRRRRPGAARASTLPAHDPGRAAAVARAARRCSRASRAAARRRRARRRGARSPPRSAQPLLLVDVGDADDARAHGARRRSSPRSRAGALVLRRARARSSPRERGARCAALAARAGRR